MIDLPTLGRELRARRKALRLPGTELAQRIGVSPTYIWLIEHAKPRTNGEPSRPSEDVLSAWTVALGMDEEETQRLRELAGYVGSPPPPSFLTAQQPSVRPPSDFRSHALRTPDRAFGPTPYAPAAPYGPAFTAEIPERPTTDAPTDLSQQAAPDENEEELTRRLRRTLDAAEAMGRLDEAATLTRSFLRWLRFHVEGDP